MHVQLCASRTERQHHTPCAVLVCCLPSIKMVRSGSLLTQAVCMHCVARPLSGLFGASAQLSNIAMHVQLCASRTERQHHTPCAVLVCCLPSIKMVRSGSLLTQAVCMHCVARPLSGLFGASAQQAHFALLQHAIILFAGLIMPTHACIQCIH